MYSRLCLKAKWLLEGINAGGVQERDMPGQNRQDGHPLLWAADIGHGPLTRANKRPSNNTTVWLCVTLAACFKS